MIAEEDIIEIADSDVPQKYPQRFPYQFDPQHEFKGHELQLSQNECLESLFMNHTTEPFCEMPLEAFENWHHDYGFNQHLLQDKSSVSQNKWTYRVWFLCPSLKNANESKELSTAQVHLLQFYKTVFYFPDKNEDTEEDESKAQKHLVENDFSIMVVGTPPTSSNPASPFLLTTHRVEDIVVLSAVTYRPTQYHESHGIHTMILWLGTSAECWPEKLESPYDHSLPTSIKSWRRLDFGRFLILTIIKQCVVMSPMTPNTNTNVTLYVQCTQDGAEQFYRECGFTTLMDNPRDDGYTQLPEVLMEALMKDIWLSFLNFQDFSEVDDETPSTVLERLEEVPAPLLLRLKPLSFRHPPEKLDQNDDKPGTSTTSQQQTASSGFVFAGFPFSTDLVVNAADFDTVLGHCPDIDWLLPRLPSRQLLLGKQMKISGSMSAERRLKHMKDATTWWDQCELDLMYSFLMRDGRYDESITIIPITFTREIQYAQKDYEKYMNVAIEDHKLRELNPLDTDEIIDRKLKATFYRPELQNPKYQDKTVLQIYEEIMQEKLNRVINRTYRSIPGIFQKKLIVYPENDDHHWMGTFVFNACNIDCKVTTNLLQPCFYRYDPMDPTGKHEFKRNNGLIWFLNLLYSCNNQEKSDEVHMDSNAGTATQRPPLRFLEPFGNSGTKGLLSGMPAFRSIILSTLQLPRLPTQYDECNCGTALVAATAIILRDWVGHETNNMFDTLFATANMTPFDRIVDGQLHESGIRFTKTAFAKGDKMVRPKEQLFLDGLRKQWIFLFDELAFLQHYYLPMRMKQSPCDEYVSLMERDDWTVTTDKTRIKKKPNNRNTRKKNKKLKQQEAAEAKRRKLEEEADLQQRIREAAEVAEEETLLLEKQRLAEEKEQLAEAERQRREEEQRAEAEEEKKRLQAAQLAEEERKRIAEAAIKKNFEEQRAEEEKKRLQAEEEKKRLEAEEEAKRLEEERKKWMETGGLGVASRPKKNSEGEAEDEEEPPFGSQEREEKDARRRAEFEHLPVVDYFAMERFVQETFKKWKWHDEKEHENWCTNTLKKAAKTRQRYANERAKKLVEPARQQRYYARCKLEREFKCLSPAVVQAIRMDDNDGVWPTFHAKVRYRSYPQEIDPEDEIHESEILVEPEWIQEWFGEDVLEHIRKFSTDKDGFVTVAEHGVTFNVHTVPIQKVRYVREKTFEGATMPEKWIGRMANGEDTDVTEEDVRKQFGDNFVDQIKQNREHKFVDIPAGECKESHLRDYPHLRVENAPRMRYRQDSGQDLCVTKSFASVLFYLGLERSAKQVDEFGIRELQGGSLFVLPKLMNAKSTLLPKWMCVRKIKKTFQWKTDIKEGEIFVGVLHPKDGNISHAVSIYKDYIFDANEEVAIKLCTEGLDYCTRGKDGRKRSYQSFWKGLVFFYQGQNMKKIDLMMRMKR